MRTAPTELRAILDVAASRRGIDFRDYRGQTLDRGIADRLRATGCGSTAEYLALLDAHPDELERLVAALVVPVTAFFRDRAVFTALHAIVLPRLIAQASRDRPLRVWSIGVSTGEEAWSIALLLDHLGAPFGLPFELLGTDIDEPALAVARRGIYDAGSLSAVPSDLRARYFRATGAGEQVDARLRPPVRFAQHDFMGHRLAPREAIVASFRLVLMRNVLIYFDRRLQDKACARLISTVEPGGGLVLGPVEMLPAEAAPFFRPMPGVPKELRIFERTEQIA